MDDAAGAYRLAVCRPCIRMERTGIPHCCQFTQWSQAQLSLTFTICMTLFCLGGFVGGLLSGKINVKINVWAAAVLFFIGFFVASRATSLTGLYIGYGVFAGFASGLAYNAVMSTMSKWFPDKQGLISGILLMGFGLGKFIIGKVYQAYTPAEIGGWRTSFFIFGIILLIVLAIGGFFFVKPGNDFVPPAPSKIKEKKNTEQGIDVNAAVMLKRPSFWLFFIWAILLSAAGLALIAQATGVATQVSKGSVDGGTIATVVGLISVFNGLGRVLFGGLFDRFGRKMTMMLVNVAFFISVCIVIASILLESFPILVVGFICCGLSYGGITPTNSAFVNSFYGATHYPVNFSMVNLNLIFASFGGTIAGMLYDASGSYLSTFILLLVAIAAGTVCSCLIRKP